MGFWPSSSLCPLPYLVGKGATLFLAPMSQEVGILNAKDFLQKGQTLGLEGLKVNVGSALYCVMICKLPNLSKPQLHHCEMGTIVPTHPRLL